MVVELAGMCGPHERVILIGQPHTREGSRHFTLEQEYHDHNDTTDVRNSDHRTKGPLQQELESYI